QAHARRGHRPGRCAIELSPPVVSAHSTATGTRPDLRPGFRATGGGATFPHLTKAYTEVAQTVRARGLLERAYGFYALLGGGLALAFAGCLAGFILLGHSWFQLLVAGSLGIVLTQTAF